MQLNTTRVQLWLISHRLISVMTAFPEILPSPQADDLPERASRSGECGAVLWPVDGLGLFVPPDGVPHTAESCAGADNRVCKQRKPLLLSAAKSTRWQYETGVSDKSLTWDGGRKLQGRIATVERIEELLRVLVDCGFQPRDPVLQMLFA